MIYTLIHLIQRFINLNFKLITFFWKLNIKLDTYHEAFWLSVLSKNQHERIIQKRYKGAKHYQLDENTRKGLSPWESKLAVDYVDSSSKIVMIGAGGGREVLALAKLGHDVEAYEADEGMVRYAQRFFEKENMPVKYATLEINRIPECRCDVFWFGWGVYTHIIGQTNRIALLKDAKERLNHHGKIVISYWAEKRLPERIDCIDRISKRINKRQVEKGEAFRALFWGKYYTKEQIFEEAQKAGLQVDYISEEGYGHAILTPE